MESPFTDLTLRRYLAGALDPARREELDAALAVDPSLAARLAQLEATTVGQELGAWRVPPPRALDRVWGLRGELRLAAAMGDAEEADYVELRVQVPPGLEAHRVALLAGEAGAWEVLLPAAPEEDRPVSGWPREADGRLRLDLDAASASARLAVALLPPDVAIDWAGASRWGAVQRALEEGRVPVMSLAVRTPGAGG